MTLKSGGLCLAGFDSACRASAPRSRDALTADRPCRNPLLETRTIRTGAGPFAKPRSTNEWPPRSFGVPMGPRSGGSVSTDRHGLTVTLLAWSIASGSVLILLLARGSEYFSGFISASDTASYMRLARAMAFEGRLIPSERTLGYPAMIAPCLRTLGEGQGCVLLVVIQVLIALGMGYTTWRLTGRLFPDAGIGRKALLSTAVWLGSLGYAFYVLSDLPASLAFFVFLYGALFWRHRTGLILAALALGFATLLRPSFTMFPVLIPWLGYLFHRMRTGTAPMALVLAVVCSFMATFANTAYQYRYNHYLGPSPVSTMNCRKLLGLLDPVETAERNFEARAQARMGHAFHELGTADQERVAVAVMAHELSDRPLQFGAAVGTTFLKYLLAPIESLAWRFAGKLPRESLDWRIRGLLVLLTAPLFLLASLPPPTRDERTRTYYLIVMTCVVYVLGLSAFVPYQGERMRLPVLPLLVTCAAMNWDAWRRLIAPPRVRSRRAETSGADDSPPVGPSPGTQWGPTERPSPSPPGRS